MADRGRSLHSGAGGGGGGPRIDYASLKAARRAEEDELDSKFGFDRFTEGPDRVGWLLNMRPNALADESGKEVSVLDCYFLLQDGTTFKASVKYQPYFYVGVKDNAEQEVETLLWRKFERYLTAITYEDKEDLDLANHLSGLKRRFLKLSFLNVQDLMNVRKDILPLVEKNKGRSGTDAYMQSFGDQSGKPARVSDYMEYINDIREYDVTYYTRVSIDLKIMCAHWYTVHVETGDIVMTRRPDLIARPDPPVCAFDIETTKLPLKFPDAAVDQVMMISYMLDKQGFLITNRSIVSEDIDNFEYTPKPDFEGPFIVFNEPNERALLMKFIRHMQKTRPLVYTTFNGDFFDWPFIEARCIQHGISLEQELGITVDNGEYRGRFSVHLDAFSWVKRDSYLPQGSQGLKAVTKAKLGYNPLELDPEDMVPYASEHPQELANYSVSDAVATYYLYMKYVHPFIFSLCTIIPLGPHDVLRKGSGTLCELLLMVEAFDGNIVCPNKKGQDYFKFHEGHLLDTETYIGGHVEAIEAGVFRSDIEYKFKLEPDALQGLLDNLERDLTFAVEVEGEFKMEDIGNFSEVRDEIEQALTGLKETPRREECPIIYHLDVAAMYPNIILSNRLQPAAIVDQQTCAACDFNVPGAQCQRDMLWIWKGEYFPADKGEFNTIRRQMEEEKFVSKSPKTEGQLLPYHDLSKDQQSDEVKKRMKGYSQQVYKKVHESKMADTVSTVCMRENSFYVDTVRAFRDRRYEYKGLLKQSKRDVDEAAKAGDALGVQDAKKMVITWDSMQLAHKCILNSFYGYVMRKGARWYSMEMAGVVTKTGADIIKEARVLIEQIGRPLELDTDGIWCMFPASFPENFTFKFNKPGMKPYTVSYPGVMLNAQTAEVFTNPQYHTVDTAAGSVKIHDECSILFEVDGPYKAMILPASLEENRQLKKRYAVFNEDNSLAELKGFELKRRGELNLVKQFQGQVFEKFLDGESLETCYESVATVANIWLDVLDTQGSELDDEEVIHLISENRSMSQALADYGEARSTSITTAKRLAEFLGEEMVKDKGLNCQFIVSRFPEGDGTSDRAIPIAIFRAEEKVMKGMLRKWCKNSSLSNFDIRSIIDWDYYFKRFAACVQKIITIPAALQRVENPVPRVEHPEWLGKKLKDIATAHQQRKLGAYFKPLASSAMDEDGTGALALQHIGSQPIGMDGTAGMDDIENLGSALAGRFAPVIRKGKKSTPKGKSTTSAAPDEIGGGVGADDVRNLKRSRFILDSEFPAEAQVRQLEMPDWEPAPLDSSVPEFISGQKDKWKWLRKHPKMTQSGQAGGGMGAGPMTAFLRDREAAADNGGSLSDAPKGSLAGFLNLKRSHSVTEGHWEIIQVVETSTPGQFKLWVLTNGGRKLSAIAVDIPRVLYINSHRDLKDELTGIGRKVNRILPCGHKTLNLYELEMSEAVYQAHSSELHDQLTDADVEGVYEAQVPLLFRAIMNLGCVCTVEPQAAKERKKKGVPESSAWSLKDLRFKSTAECLYLNGEDCEDAMDQPAESRPLACRKCFLYYSVSDTRGILGFFDEGEDGAGTKGKVYVINPFNKIERAHFGSMFADAGVTDYKVEYVTSKEDAFRRLRRHVTDLRAEVDLATPILILKQSPLSVTQMTELIPVLSEFPVVTVPANDGDNKFLALQWIAPAAKTMMARFGGATDEWWRDQLQFVRYAHVPIGNLEEDYPVFVSDLFLARVLKQQQHVLWISETNLPDFGGHEKEGNVITDDSEVIIGTDTTEILNPGVYSDVSVEFDLSRLAVNTVLQSEHLDDVEGVSSSTQLLSSASGGHLVDEGYASKGAFGILKMLVERLLTDISETSNPYADLLLQHMYRWLDNTRSFLFHPHLLSVLNGMMKKVFMLMIGEMRSLGVTVVQANFQRVIINLSKTNGNNAPAFCDYMIRNLQSKPLFLLLDLSAVNVWQHLCYMDTANFGGVLDPQTLRMMTGQEDDEDEPASMQLEIVSNWNVAEFLPKAVQEAFLITISEFIYLPIKYRNEKEASKGADLALARLLTRDLAAGEDADVMDHDAGASAVKQPQNKLATFQSSDNNKELQKWLQQEVNNKIAKKLYRIIPDIDAHIVPNTGNETYDFPKPAGSHLNPSNPALEFSKAVCHIISLDPTLEAEVTQLKKNLLRILRVREFSAETEFVNPCCSVVLPTVICSFCNSCRDLDLCRDPELMNGSWRCSTCDHAYNIGRLEERLVLMLQRRVKLYLLQDLHCVKTRVIKADILSRHSMQGAQFDSKVKPQDMKDCVSVFLSIAQYHNLEWLGQVATWILTNGEAFAPEEPEEEEALGDDMVEV